MRELRQRPFALGPKQPFFLQLLLQLIKRLLQRAFTHQFHRLHAYVELSALLKERRFAEHAHFHAVFHFNGHLVTNGKTQYARGIVFEFKKMQLPVAHRPVVTHFTLNHHLTKATEVVVRKINELRDGNGLRFATHIMWRGSPSPPQSSCLDSMAGPRRFHFPSSAPTTMRWSSMSLVICGPSGQPGNVSVMRIFTMFSGVTSTP